MMGTGNGHSKKQGRFNLRFALGAVLLVLITAISGCQTAPVDNAAIPTTPAPPTEIPVLSFDSPFHLESLELQISRLRQLPSVLMLEGDILVNFYAPENQFLLVLEMQLLNSRNAFCLDAESFQLSGEGELFELISIGTAVPDNGDFLIAETNNNSVDAARIGFEADGYIFVQYLNTNTGIAGTNFVVAKPGRRWLISPLNSGERLSFALLFAPSSSNLSLQMQDLQFVLPQPEIEEQAAKAPEFMLELVPDEVQQLSIDNMQCDS
jgi:hypothetical protein